MTDRELNELVKMNQHLKNIHVNTMVCAAFVVLSAVILFGTVVVGLDAVSTSVYTEM